VKRVVTSVVALLLLMTALAACSTSSPSVTPALPAAPPPAWDGTVGPRDVDPACTGDPASPQPGDVVCFTGELDDPLEITVGGLPDAPIVYSGDGGTRVPGIRAEADHIVIQGFVSDGADSTGIWAAGRNVTIQDNVVTQVRYTQNDVDGIRFFGDGARVLHNAVEDLEGTDEVGDAHVDCMQSFATSRPGSQNVVIQGNRCEGIRAQCLMAEGPDTADGSGQGVSRNWLFRGNYCDSYAEAQSVAFVDVQDVTITDNEMAGEGNKAFALGKDSTGTVVRGNRIGPGYGREVGFDDPSAGEGYRGPAAR
jgi:predicted small lipoprotein YifL